MYKIIDFKNNRFAIADENSKIVDDANGYGYKSKQSANIAMNYKFNGGKQKNEQKRANAILWFKENNLSQKKIEKELDDLIEWNFKEIARGETTIDELFEEIESGINIKIPKEIRKFIQKNS